MNRNVTVLNEILTGEWLMSPMHLLQIGHVMKQVVAGGVDNGKEQKPTISALSFYNEELQRIDPRNANEVPAGSVAVVRIIGPIMKYWSWYFLGADEVIEQLDFANNLPNVSAIVAIVDGPGGAVSAISPFIEFAKRKKKPIVALCDASLSLHRWIPDAIADYQMADNNISARFGSIGVMAQWQNTEKYYEDMGVFMEEVYPVESSHKNEFSRMYKDDQEKAREFMRENTLSPMAQKFQAAVRAAHPTLLEEEGVLNGRTFGADEAVRLNMIDKVGGLNEAMLLAQSLSELSTNY